MELVDFWLELVNLLRELEDLLDGVSESFEEPWWTFWKELVDLLE